MRSITIIHPSRLRPTMAAKTIENWFEKSDNPNNINYILSLDNTDPKLSEYRKAVRKYRRLEIITNNNKSAIEAINITTESRFCDGEILIVVSDDFDCPLHWDKLLLEVLDGKTDFIVKTKDGIQPFIITLPIMDRTYYNRFGYVYHPEYVHMFCDTEMSAVGHLLGRTINIDIEFKHNHYTTGAMKKDAINIKNDKTWTQGENLYKERCKKLFDLNPSDIIQELPDMLNIK